MKEPFLSSTKWIMSGFKTTASMSIGETLVFRVIEPIAVAILAWNGGVLIGSLGVAISEEF